MAKDKSIFTCTECGGTSARWMGKCPSCNAWNTLIEGSSEPAAGKNRFGSVHASLAPTSEVLPLAQIEAADFERQPTTGPQDTQKSNWKGYEIGHHDGNAITFLRAQPVLQPSGKGRRMTVHIRIAQCLAKGPKCRPIGMALHGRLQHGGDGFEGRCR
jgi:hypothetical protein